MDPRNLHLDREFLARLKELFHDRDVNCPDCGYSLRGIPGPRCPECGRKVTGLLREADLTPWRTPSARARVRRRQLLYLLGAFTVLAAAAGAASCWVLL